MVAAHGLLIAVVSLVAELRASVVAAHAQQSWRMNLPALWQVNPPGPGIEPMPPALASGFLCPQGSLSMLVFSLPKSFIYFFFFCHLCFWYLYSSFYPTVMDTFCKVNPLWVLP